MHKELQPGDRFVSHNEQPAIVESVTITDRRETVYNLRASQDHTYFVGRGEWVFSVWAHNRYDVFDLEDGTFRIVDTLRSTADNSVYADEVVYSTRPAAEAAIKDFEKITDLPPPPLTKAVPANAPRVNITKEMAANSEVIARGASIRKIDELILKFGGTTKCWIKKKGWDAAGNEWHWYEHHGIGRVGVKLIGEIDPF